MAKPRIYIGYKKIQHGDGWTTDMIVIEPKPSDLCEEHYEVTSDSGEGSFEEIMKKIEERCEK